MRRVVVTGVGVVSPIGGDLTTAVDALERGGHGVVVVPEWDAIEHLSTRLAAPVSSALSPALRKRTRTMGRVGKLALEASDQAIANSGLTPTEVSHPRTGLAYGSTHGSTAVTEEFCRRLSTTSSMMGLEGSAYLKFMSHTCAANLAQVMQIVGRVVPVISACTSASQSIGAGYEAIKYGLQDVMICGGAEELHSMHAVVFDLVYAASSAFNEQPDRSPRPFDAARDGLVVGEGAGTFVLEEFERAKARGATILGELLGYGTCCDGSHVTAPSAAGMAQAMTLALEDAGVRAAEIQYINAHATATTVGDRAESAAVHSVFGERVPISSTKGHTGHTLGACGAIEAAFCLEFMRRGFVPPTRNLERIDEACAPLDYVQGQLRELALETVMTNNFAFGGINTSLIFRRV